MTSHHIATTKQNNTINRHTFNVENGKRLLLVEPNTPTKLGNRQPTRVNCHASLNRRRCEARTADHCSTSVLSCSASAVSHAMRFAAICVGCEQSLVPNSDAGSATAICIVSALLSASTCARPSANDPIGLIVVGGL
jgi:hypothetical protein